jgi:hypothetical protein
LRVGQDTLWASCLTCLKNSPIEGRGTAAPPPADPLVSLLLIVW